MQIKLANPPQWWNGPLQIGQNLDMWITQERLRFKALNCTIYFVFTVSPFISVLVWNELEEDELWEVGLVVHAENKELLIASEPLRAIASNCTIVFWYNKPFGISLCSQIQSASLSELRIGRLAYGRTLPSVYLMNDSELRLGIIFPMFYSLTAFQRVYIQGDSITRSGDTPGSPRGSSKTEICLYLGNESEFWEAVFFPGCVLTAPFEWW